MPLFLVSFAALYLEILLIRWSGLVRIADARNVVLDRIEDGHSNSNGDKPAKIHEDTLDSLLDRIAILRQLALD